LDSIAGDTTTFTSAARNVRVSADGRVIVGTYLAGHSLSGAVLQYDLSTGRDTVAFARTREKERRPAGSSAIRASMR